MTLSLPFVNLNLIRTEALSFIKCLLWCVLYGLLLSQGGLPFEQFQASTLKPPRHDLLSPSPGHYVADRPTLPQHRDDRKEEATLSGWTGL